MYTSTVVALGLAASAVAAPTGKSARSRLAARNAARSARNGRVIERVGFADEENSSSTSTNWSGAVLESYSSQWQTVTGTITMPTPKAPSGGAAGTTYSASAWVGIDGDSCQRALWQTGVDFNVKGSSVSYDAWWEWIPAGANNFNGISFSAGDSVTMTVTASSATTGTAVIENTTTGKKVSKTTTGSASLCFQDAEWIVEDFEENGGLVPLANWGTVTFTNATATSSSGAATGPASADTINLKHGGSIVTSTSTDDSSVTVQYTGN